MMVARQILLCIALLPMWALLPPQEATHEVTKCNCIKRDATPTWQQLTQLDVPGMGLSVRIIDKIGSNYYTLATDLLNDEDGGIIRMIERNHRFIEERLSEIFHRWIKGHGQRDGKKINTWDMLVKYLKYAKLLALADEIESILQFCSESTMHMDDKECIHGYREHIHDHEVPVETKPSLQHLGMSLLVAILIAGATIFCCTLKQRATNSNVTLGVNEYTAYLKSRYKAMAQNCNSSDDDWPPPVTEKVFRLAMIKAEEVKRMNIEDDFVRHSITGKVDDILKKKVPIELNNIFAGIEKGQQRKVLIEGAPGCGKSTLSVHICHEWTKGNIFTEYSQVMLVQLRELTIQNAERIANLLPRRDETMGHELKKEINSCNGKGSLFIFDSWDELPMGKPGYKLIKSILSSDILHESSIIITSRPVSSTSLQRIVNSRIEILGFTKDELQHYFRGCLNDDMEKVTILQERISENPVVAGSCYLPLNASILVYLFKCGGSKLPVTQYGIFYEFVYSCVYRHLLKTKEVTDTLKLKSLEDLPPRAQTQFNKLCEIAYNGVKEDKIIFDLEPRFNTLGLLHGVESFTVRGKSHSYNFLHLSIQEVLAAMYMATQLNEDQQIEQFRNLFGQARFSAVFYYYSGMTKMKTPGIDGIVVDVVKECVQNNATTEFSSSHRYYDPVSGTGYNLGHEPQPLLLSLLHCLFEAQDKDLCQLVAKELKGNLNLGGISLSPADCLVVGYFLTYCKQFHVDLGVCSIDDDGCKALFRKGQQYDLRTLDLEGNTIGDEGAAALSSVMKTMTNLQGLDLDHNTIDNKGAAALFSAMKTMTNLQGLYLTNNAIGDVGREALEEAAKEIDTKIYGLETKYQRSNP